MGGNLSVVNQHNSRIMPRCLHPEPQVSGDNDLFKVDLSAIDTVYHYFQASGCLEISMLS